MERIQLYPSDELKAIMTKQAESESISLSQLTINILMEHYGLSLDPSQKKDLPQITETVLEEVKEFLSDKSEGFQFDLLTASNTFKNIHMLALGRPSTTRATVGKVFASRLGKEPFEHIAVMRTKDGAVKKSINKATMYIVNG